MVASSGWCNWDQTGSCEGVSRNRPSLPWTHCHRSHIDQARQRSLDRLSVFAWDLKILKRLRQGTPLSMSWCLDVWTIRQSVQTRFVANENVMSIVQTCALWSVRLMSSYHECHQSESRCFPAVLFSAQKTEPRRWRAARRADESPWTVAQALRPALRPVPSASMPVPLHLRRQRQHCNLQRLQRCMGTCMSISTENIWWLMT